MRLLANELEPFTLSDLAIPTPPLTIKEPLLLLVDSVVFDMVAIPAELNFDPTKRDFAIPNPPANTRLPLDEEVLSVVLLKVTIPDMIAPPKTLNPLLTVVNPDIVRFPPITVFLAIPIPPENTAHPEFAEFESAVPCTMRELLRVALPPTKTDFATPRPPAVVKEPVDALDESVVPVIFWFTIAIVAILTLPNKFVVPATVRFDAM